MALLLETAKFWISRTVRVNDRLEIHDVIGPDEYTEHVNNNAFTSYMAYYNVQQALNIARQFGCSDDAFIHRAEMFLKELRLPEIQPDRVLCRMSPELLYPKSAKEGRFHPLQDS